MILGKLNKHKSNTDVAFLPKAKTELQNGIVVFEGIWYNIVNKPFVIGPDTIKVLKTELNNWRKWK